MGNALVYVIVGVVALPLGIGLGYLVSRMLPPKKVPASSPSPARSPTQAPYHSQPPPQQYRPPPALHPPDPGGGPAETFSPPLLTPQPYQPPEEPVEYVEEPVESQPDYDSEPDPRSIRDGLRQEDREKMLGQIADLPIQWPAGRRGQQEAGDLWYADDDAEADQQRLAPGGQLCRNERIERLYGDEGWAETGESMQDVYTQTIEARPDLMKSWGANPEGRHIDLPYNPQRGDPARHRCRVFPEGVKGGPNPGVCAPAPTGWRQGVIGDLPRELGFRSNCWVRDEDAPRYMRGRKQRGGAQHHEEDLLRPLLGGDHAAGLRLLAPVVAPPRGLSIDAKGRSTTSLVSALSDAPATSNARPYGFQPDTRDPKEYTREVEMLNPPPGYARPKAARTGGGSQPLEGRRLPRDVPEPWRRPHQVLSDTDARGVRPPFVVPRLEEVMKERERQEMLEDEARQKALEAAGAQDDEYNYGEEEEDWEEGYEDPEQ